MIVVGCGSAKLSRPAPARELYTGSLFVAARRYAEASRKPWVVLSGLHGVIAPELVIRPYDSGLPYGVGVEPWARRAAVEVQRRMDGAGVVTILAGGRHASWLAGALHEFDIESEQPLAGLGVGHRLQRLKQMTEALARRA